MTISPTIRTLRANDVPRILTIASTAGWTQTASDLERMLRYAPDGCFGIDLAAEAGWPGGLASTAMAFSHGAQLGWIAMVLTDPALRGRGLASLLMERCIGHLRGRGIHWIKLDASHLGRPIYERMGFQAENVMERRLRASAPLPPARTTVAEVQEAGDSLPLALDRHAFGADRSRLLEMLRAADGARCASLSGGGGYAILRPKKGGVQFGPMVCEDAAGAEALLRWALQIAGEQRVQWDFIQENVPAVDLADAYGFEAHRVLHRMALKGNQEATPFDGQTHLVYAIAGFDFG